MWMIFGKARRSEKNKSMLGQGRPASEKRLQMRNIGRSALETNLFDQVLIAVKKLERKA